MKLLRWAAGAALVVGASWPSAAGAQPADEHAAAQAIVTEVTAGAHATETAEVVARAKDALERATRLRVAGDEAHAKAADGVAFEWAEMARDVARAADAEARAADLRKKAVEAQAQLDRSRALVESAIAGIGRLRAEIEQARASTAPPRHTAVEIHDGEAPPPAKAAKKPGATQASKPAKADAGKTP